MNSVQNLLLLEGTSNINNFRKTWSGLSGLSGVKGMWSMGKLYYAYHLYYGAMNNQERIAPNKSLQSDNLRAVVCVMFASLTLCHTNASA